MALNHNYQTTPKGTSAPTSTLLRGPHMRLSCPSRKAYNFIMHSIFCFSSYSVEDISVKLVKYRKSNLITTVIKHLCSLFLVVFWTCGAYGIILSIKRVVPHHSDSLRSIHCSLQSCLVTAHFPPIWWNACLLAFSGEHMLLKTAVSSNKYLHVFFRLLIYPHLFTPAESWAYAAYKQPGLIDSVSFTFSKLNFQLLTFSWLECWENIVMLLLQGKLLTLRINVVSLKAPWMYRNVSCRVGSE